MTRRLAPALVALLATAALAVPARASYEQFSGFEVMAPEVDDESAFDYYLSRPVDDWSEEWERATSGVRADEGCMTSSIWYQSNTFKARSTLGQHSWLDTGFQQVTDPAGSYEWLQFDFVRHTAGSGSWGARYRPAYDKSAQDFALLWSTGDGTTPLEAHLTFTLEDAFNKLWTFRQSQVGDSHWEPYGVHPYEPSFVVVSRGPRHRVEVAGTWLTPSTRRIVDPDPLIAGSNTLRGTAAHVYAQRTDGAWTSLARFEHQAARSTQAVTALPGDGLEDRTRWSAELAVRRRLAPRWRLEGGYLYMRRAEDWRPPLGNGTFAALDRVGHAELAWQVRDGWSASTGLLYDRIGVAQSGAPPGFTYGSRKEARATLGLQARFGKVRLQGTEGIQLSTKPYPVTFHHDKGFLHLQTTF